MPIIIGLVIVGGILILLTGKKEEDPITPPPQLDEKNLDSPSGEQVNVEEIRRLRRELRHQLAKRKKNSQT